MHIEYYGGASSRRIASLLLTTTLLCFSIYNNSALAYCIDTPPVGDGWGRDGTQFCIIEPGCEYTNAAENEGFGWNPTTEESCPPVADHSHEDCDYTHAALHRGWGWSVSAQESCPPTETTIGRTCDYSDAAINLGYGWNDAEQMSCAPLTDTTVITPGDYVFIAATFEHDIQTDGLQSIATASSPEPVSIDQTEFPRFDQHFDIDVDTNSVTFTVRTTTNTGAAIEEDPEQTYRYFIGFANSTIDSATLIGSDSLVDNLFVELLEPGFILNPEFVTDGGITDPVDFINGGVMLELTDAVDPALAGATATIILELIPESDNPEEGSSEEDLAEDEAIEDDATEDDAIEDDATEDDAIEDDATEDDDAEVDTSNESTTDVSSPEETAPSDDTDSAPIEDATSPVANHTVATQYKRLTLPVPVVSPGLSWADSYSHQNSCYIASSFDHGAGELKIGGVSVQAILEMQSGPGIEHADAIYNDINCGNGPANSAGDENWCPGRVDLGVDGCVIAGPDIVDQLQE